MGDKSRNLHCMGARSPGVMKAVEIHKEASEIIAILLKEVDIDAEIKYLRVHEDKRWRDATREWNKKEEKRLIAIRNRATGFMEKREDLQKKRLEALRSAIKWMERTDDGSDKSIRRILGQETLDLLNEWRELAHESRG